MSRLIISENDRKYIKSLYNIINEDAKTIAKDIYDASSGVGTDEEKFLKAVLSIDTLETFKEVDRILKSFDYGGGFYDYVEGELGMFDEELINKIKKHIKSLKSKKQSVINNNFKDGTTLRASQEFWDNIKVHEGLEGTNGKPALKAYTLGDGKITIGWGHAEPIKTSKYRVGDTITKEEAQRLLQEDATKAANCVRRMLNEWKTKKTDEGKEIKGYMLTQSMFDVLVSLAFNAGCTGLRTSYFIRDYVKWGDYKGAAKMLPTDKSMINGDFTIALTRRRNSEAKRFKKEL